MRSCWSWTKNTRNGGLCIQSHQAKNEQPQGEKLQNRAAWLDTSFIESFDCHLRVIRPVLKSKSKGERSYEVHRPPSKTPKEHRRSARKYYVDSRPPKMRRNQPESHLSIKHETWRGLFVSSPLRYIPQRHAGVIGSLHNKIRTPPEFAAFWPYFGIIDIRVWNRMVPAPTSIHFENVQCLFGLQLTFDMLNPSTSWVENLSELPPTSVILKGMASALSFQVSNLPLLHSLVHSSGSNIFFYL